MKKEFKDIYYTIIILSFVCILFLSLLFSFVYVLTQKSEGSIKLNCNSGFVGIDMFRNQTNTFNNTGEYFKLKNIDGLNCNIEINGQFTLVDIFYYLLDKGDKT